MGIDFLSFFYFKIISDI